jgi:hypothetical protein
MAVSICFGALSASCRAKPMFRAMLVTVVLTLSVGQEARLLCQLWCHPAETVTSDCHHQADANGSPRLQSDSRCDGTLTPFLREEVRRHDESTVTHAVFVVFRHHVSPDMIGARPDLVPVHQARRALDTRPIDTTLRV